MRRYAAFLLGCALAALLLAGCAPRTDGGEDGLRLWFPARQTNRDFAGALGACPYAGGESVPELMRALLAGPPADSGLAGAIPSGARVLGWSLEDQVASVELSAPYAALTGVELTLADYCITLTLTQLPGVEGVRITVNGAGQSYRERRVLYPGDVILSGGPEGPADTPAPGGEEELEHSLKKTLDIPPAGRYTIYAGRGRTHENQ